MLSKPLAALLTAGVLFLPGCSADEQAAVPDGEVVAEGEALGEGVPAPTGDAVLSVTGATAEPNLEGRVAFDLATLERLRTERWTLYEPFVERELTFTGVPLAALLEVVGVPADAQQVVFDALDDYRATLTLAQARAGDVLVATRQDGDEISIEDGGPIRLVFRDGSATGTNPDLWIWSIRSMIVE